MKINEEPDDSGSATKSIRSTKKSMRGTWMSRLHMQTKRDLTKVLQIHLSIKKKLHCPPMN